MSTDSSIEVNTNSNELELVNSLACEVKNLLTDRGGERHPPPWEPRQNVVVGVLPATVSPPPPVVGEEEEEDEEEDDHSAKETDNTAASIDDVLRGAGSSLPSIGMTFQVRSKSPIAVTASLEFAIYVEEYATLEELRRHLSITTSDDRDLSDEGADVDKDTEFVAAPQRRTVTVLGAWRRIPISLSNLELRINLDESHAVLEQPIDEAIRRAIDEHFDTAVAARPFSSRTRTISSADIASPDAYVTALRSKQDAAYTPVYPRVQLTGFSEPLGNDLSLVNVSVTNASVLSEYPFQDLNIYDCRMKLTVAQPAMLQRQRFDLAPRDYRFREVSEVWGQGNACVVTEGDAGELVAETLPIFEQPVVSPRVDHVAPLKWADLAKNPRPVLDSIEAAMCDYLQEWGEFIQSAEPDIAAESTSERSRFEQEIERFRLGRRAMQVDERLERAFRLANQVFSAANSDKPYDSWHLFQIVYLVSHLPDLAAREQEFGSAFRTELEFTDVLWVPTGGGKTEAYLGLIVTSLIYDRLRGKTKGVTAWLKFPLRMLSVQQLSRVLRILIEAERIRSEELGKIGEPFELGYLVGGSNTPNQLRWEKAWWPGFEAATKAQKGTFDEWRLLAECPFCNEEAVGIDVDSQARRLRHSCRACGKALPLHMSDEEIYRFMPSILVGTVDKLTGLSWFGEFTQFSHGARWRCPDHGYFTFAQAGRCPASVSDEEIYRFMPSILVGRQAHWLAVGRTMNTRRIHAGYRVV